MSWPFSPYARDPDGETEALEGSLSPADMRECGDSELPHPQSSSDGGTVHPFLLLPQGGGQRRPKAGALSLLGRARDSCSPPPMREVTRRAQRARTQEPPFWQEIQRGDWCLPLSLERDKRCPFTTGI